MRKFIVGLDPGTTTALCILSFEGEVITSVSEKHFPPREVVSVIASVGRPSLFATDRAEVPSLVEEVASSFGSPVYSPEEDISREDKREMTSGRPSGDVHERDALAAALAARNAHRDLFRKVDIRAPAGKREELKDLLLREEVHNIREAIRTHGEA